MFETLFRAFIKPPRRKNFLLALWTEINANLERYYVVDQRGFISASFDLTSWKEANDYSGLVFPPEVLAYAVALEDFNLAYADCRAFEEMYSSGIQNKTHANAEILHAKKELLEQKIPTIQPLILVAQQALRPMMDKH